MQQLPKSISKTISDISVNESIFKQWISYYENALKNSESNVSLKNTPPQDQDENNQQREERKRKNVKTKAGKLFLKCLDHHFPKAHKCHKIFNYNTVTISYCCMINMNSIISSHSKQVLQPSNKNYGCN